MSEWTKRRKVITWLTVGAVVALAIAGGVVYAIDQYPVESLAIAQVLGYVSLVGGSIYLAHVITKWRNMDTNQRNRPAP
jgi:hypothetical protein